MAKNDTLTRDDLHEVLAEFYSGHLEPQFRKIDEQFERIDHRFNGIENRLNTVEVELRHVKDEIKGLKADLFDSPTRKEFNEVTNRINRYHPSS